MKNNREILIDHILHESEDYLLNEDFLTLLLEKSKLPTEDDKSFAQVASDNLSKFAGSWIFIGIFSFIIICWMCVNIMFLTSPFDPYPFILLNLVLSCVSALQAPLIMMSQNRQEAKDRIRARSDYRVNLKTKIILMDIYDMIKESKDNIKSK